MTERHSYLRTHDLAAEHMLIDLGEADGELRERAAGQDRQGITLVKQSGLNVVLTFLKSGASLAEHAAPGAATVQVVEGRIRAQVGGNDVEVAAGQVLAFDADVRHSVEALEESTLLLTLADRQP